MKKKGAALLLLGAPDKGAEDDEDEETFEVSDDDGSEEFDSAFADFAKAWKAGKTDAAKEAFRRAVMCCHDEE